MSANKINFSEIDGYSTDSPYKFGVLALLCMLYVTFKLSCNPMFFRQASFEIPFINFIIKVNCSSLIFPAIYIISDIITYLTSRKTAICIILFGIFCDGVFSYSMNFVVHIPNPTIPLSATQVSFLNSVNHVGSQMWLLYYSGVVAAIIAAVGEVILFSFIFHKVKSFFFSTSISIITTLLLHNSINEYAMLKHEKDALYVIASNLTLDSSIMLVYVSIISIILKIIKILYFNRVDKL